MKEFMAITKALSDPNRVRVLLALRRGELCVCQITELFGFAPSTVSRHLAVLRAAVLVEERRVGRHRLYRLNPAPLRDLYDWAGLFADFWTERMANLRRHLERKHET